MHLRLNECAEKLNLLCPNGITAGTALFGMDQLRIRFWSVQPTKPADFAGTVHEPCDALDPCTVTSNLLVVGTRSLFVAVFIFVPTPYPSKTAFDFVHGLITFFGELDKPLENGHLRQKKNSECDVFTPKTCTSIG